MRLMIEAALAAATALTAVLGPVLQQPETRTAPALPTVVVAPGMFAFRLPGEYLKGGWPVDAPERTVAFRRGFEIMQDEVSAADYAACAADGACKATENGTASLALPVTGVSYRDAVAYAAWLSERTGENWRLPTDEEWSFAAGERLHDDSLGLPQETGNPSARWLARYRAEAATDKHDAEPKPLGSFGTNSKGLADIAGNVWEWTATCYTRAAIGGDGQVAQSTENCGVRVVAGRHRGYMSTFIRDGRSGGCAVGLAPDNLGFRLVREKLSLVGRMRLLLAEALQGWLG